MQKKYLGLAGLVSLLLVSAVLISGCGKSAAVNNANNQNQNQEQDQTDNQANEVVNPSGTYSINELLSMNRPMKCSWKESITQGGEVTNIIYINGKKFYQDVTMGDVGHAYTVSDGEYIYIWNNFNNAASKIKIEAIPTTTGLEPAETQDSAGLDQSRDFECEKWTVDNSVFNPPSDKNFIDVTEEMGQAVEELQENAEEYQQQACDMCRQAPAQELIDECLRNMQCD